MKYFTSIFICLLCCGCLQGFSQDAPVLFPDSARVQADSVDQELQDKIIDEVVNADTLQQKTEEVQYLSKVTKYGFKNLFKDFTYNPTLPYTAQVNPFAENYMKDYAEGHQDHLLRLKKTGLPYFNFIDGILTQYGLPHELKYLAVIESDLKANALSHAGALGPWQFMPATARGYGLRVDRFVDERTDYNKSTHAAARYLLDLYKEFNDWLLVIAAYNGGAGRVERAIRESGSHDFWKLQYDLPEESRKHVKKFIATHYVMEAKGSTQQADFDYQQLRYGDQVPDLLTDVERAGMDSTNISGKYFAKVIASFVDMEMLDFNRYNPGLDRALALGKDYMLRLPEEKLKDFEQQRYQILENCVNQLFQSATINRPETKK